MSKARYCMANARYSINLAAVAGMSGPSVGERGACLVEASYSEAWSECRAKNKFTKVTAQERGH